MKHLPLFLTLSGLLLLLVSLWKLWHVSNPLPEQSPRPYDLARLMMDAGVVS